MCTGRRRARHSTEARGGRCRAEECVRNGQPRCRSLPVHDQWERVEIHIVIHLLRRGVVLVVLVAPERRGHAAARAVEHDLERDVGQQVAGERAVPALVHEPPAPPLPEPERRDACNP